MGHIMIGPGISVQIPEALSAIIMNQITEVARLQSLPTDSLGDRQALSVVSFLFQYGKQTVPLHMRRNLHPAQVHQARQHIQRFDDIMHLKAGRQIMLRGGRISNGTRLTESSAG